MNTFVYYTNELFSGRPTLYINENKKQCSGAQRAYNFTKIRFTQMHVHLEKLMRSRTSYKISTFLNTAKHSNKHVFISIFEARSGTTACNKIMTRCFQEQSNYKPFSRTRNGCRMATLHGVKHWKANLYV